MAEFKNLKTYVENLTLEELTKKLKACGIKFTKVTTGNSYSGVIINGELKSFKDFFPELDELKE